ncbi:MAG TPA: carbamoyltransferase C-terminal domain-containing protein [Casimicrobiaceae bacterium]
MRVGPRHPRLAAAGFRTALPLVERFYASKQIYRSTSRFAAERLHAVRAALERGETVYLGGIGAAGLHNSGVALIEVSRERGPRIVCNNEEERFSGRKHTADFPRHALAALTRTMERLGIGPERVAAWLATWDYPAFAATIIRTVLEEFPASLSLLRTRETPFMSADQLDPATRGPRHLGRALGLPGAVPFIGMPHHDNHAWFSFSVSPFACSATPVMVSVLDGTGDLGAISLYVVENGSMRQLRCNRSVFDSLGTYYGVISSTQGGWTLLSSEGRYMGAAAYGNSDRATNAVYAGLRNILSLQADGQIYLNRALANWPREFFAKPYTPELIRILGEPVTEADMWNPDAVLRVEDIRHRPQTQDRLDKAAATQLVFEDAMIHVVDFLIRGTGSDRLVLTGGTALNAVANMRLLEHFDESYYERVLGRRTRLHLWVPPVPNDAGVTLGAAYLFAYHAGAGVGAPLEHAFYCGSAPTEIEIRSALGGAPDVVWISLDNGFVGNGQALADLMAYITARDGVIAIFQGAAETGPRALGHRSILANPCNPRTREVLNERVKYREAIRPLAPMLTLDAARQWFELSNGAADGDYNAYSYMVLTARAKAAARERIPAVIHRDGTGRLQIVREHTDPLMYAYLKALGRRIGVEVAVNTSFNVAGPIAQTAVQAIETLRRSKGMDALIMIAEEGSVFAAWHRNSTHASEGGRFRRWLAEWRAETGALVAQA